MDGSSDLVLEMDQLLEEGIDRMLNECKVMFLQSDDIPTPSSPVSTKSSSNRSSKAPQRGIKEFPPVYLFIRNLLHNRHYNPKVISWVCQTQGIFKINHPTDLAKIWGKMKANKDMNYEKMSRAMRYHYGNQKEGRKGHLAMVKRKNLMYQFGELTVNWRFDNALPKNCREHDLCKTGTCLWTRGHVKSIYDVVTDDLETNKQFS